MLIIGYCYGIRDKTELFNKIPLKAIFQRQMTIGLHHQTEAAVTNKLSRCGRRSDLHAAEGSNAAVVGCSAWLGSFQSLHCNSPGPQQCQ